MREAGHGEMKNVYKILIRKPDGKRSPRRPRHIWRILDWILKK
jgi:hypothetical protein